MTSGEPSARTPSNERKLDLESLKALAHPLRVQLLDTLSIYGPFTASGLADRLGESSGATSYHLRQLEKHGFVREVEGRGTGRERWWERVPGAITLSTPDAASPAAVAASRTVLRQWERSRSTLLNDFLERGLDVLPEQWTEASVVSTANIRVTAEQLESIAAQWEEFMVRVVDAYRGKNPPGSRPVQIHFNAFPVLGGTTNTEKEVAE